MIEKSQFLAKMVILFHYFLGDNFKFDKVLERNEKSNKSKNVGLVSGMLKGI